MAVVAGEHVLVFSVIEHGKLLVAKELLVTPGRTHTKVLISALLSNFLDSVMNFSNMESILFLQNIQIT